MIEYIITPTIEDIEIKADQIIIEESGRLAFDINHEHRIFILDEVRGEIALLQPAHEELLETVGKDVVEAINELLEGIESKVDKIEGKGLSTEDFTAEEKEKLFDIEELANNYTHPETHPPTIIKQDSENRFATDEERAKWEGNGYTHPATHPPSIIEQDSENRFVTDAEKAAWSDKSDVSQFFSIVAYAANWNEGSQTIVDADFVLDGYDYILSSVPTNFTEFGEAGIRAGNLTAEGEIRFVCDEPPTEDLIIYVLRIQAKTGGGRVFNAGGQGAPAAKVESIEIVTPPTKTIYEAGETFSTAGMIVIVTYSDGISTVATRYSFSPNRPLVLGDSQIIIQYTESGVTRSAVQPITVTRVRLNIPSQLGKTTYSGGIQSPTWKDYNLSAMWISGATSGKDTGSYTAVFTIKDTDTYEWIDESIDDKYITWTISRAPGSLSITPIDMTLTLTARSKVITVDRPGNGVILAVSDDPGIARVEVNGTLVTVIGVSSGSTFITILAGQGTNYEETTTRKCTVEVDLSRKRVSIPSQNGSLVYNGSPRTPSWNNYNKTLMTMSGATEGVEIGSYLAVFTLKDTEYYEWSDGTDEPKGAEWRIDKAAGKLNITPSSMNLTLFNRVQSILVDRLGDGEISFESSNPGVATVELIGTTTIVVTAKSTGSTTITISAAEGTSYTAAPDKTCLVTVDMSKKKLLIPTQNGSLVYTGTPQTPTWNGYDMNTMKLSGLTSQTEIGIYTVTFTLKNTEYYEWEDGTPLSKEVEWRISQSAGRLNISPTSLALDLYHRSGTIEVDRDGDGEITVISTNPSVAEAYIVGTTIMVVGKATGQAGIRVSVAAGTNHGAPNDKTCSVSVNFARTKLTVPSQLSGLTYNGAAQSPNWSNYNPSLMNLSGTTSEINAGTYEVSFELSDTEFYEWRDGTTASKRVTWKINKKAGRLVISPSTLLLDLFNPTRVIEIDRDGDGEIIVTSSKPSVATATLVGSTAVVAGKADGQAVITISVGEGTNYSAPSNKTCSVTVDFSKTKVTIPTVGGSLSYNGVPQSPSWNGYDTSLMSMSGAVDGTNAGDYEAIFTLLDIEHYEWSNGTIGDKSVVWTIDKAPGSLEISPTSMELDDSTPSGVITITRIGNGEISFVNSRPQIASATLLGNTITVTKKQDGRAEIIVSVAEGANYAAPPSQTCEVQIGGNLIYGVSWDGTATTKLSRTDSAESFMNPVPYMAGISGYGSPFDNIYPWSGMTRVSDPQAGELVVIPKYWYKWTKTGNTTTLKIAVQENEGFLVSPAHADRGDGKGEREVVYVGRYHCSADDYKSAAGKSPKVSISRSAARTSIADLGEEIWQYDYAMYWTIMMLYLVEFADWNSQAKIGYGCGNNLSPQTTGTSDTMPYHTGTMRSARSIYGLGCQYRNIEGLWESCYDWCDGIYFNNTNIYCTKNPVDFSDESGGTLVGAANLNGYITGWSVPTAAGFEYALYPSSTGGSDSTYVPDYCEFSPSGVVLRTGGDYGHRLDHGLFCLFGNYTASDIRGFIGCRLQKLPG